MTTLLNKIVGKLKKISRKRHNMLSHPAERYYFELYWPYIEPHLRTGSRLLEIGCQYGRFTIPMAEKGLHVTATDIHAHYFTAIKKHLGNNEIISFYKETIHQSLSYQPIHEFDHIVCLELLYTLPDYREILAGFRKKMKTGSLFIGSHRSTGYYLYRFLKENNVERAKRVLKGEDPVFNAVDKKQLEKVYEELGFRVVLMKPIGIFSGCMKDPFEAIANPGKMKHQQSEELKTLETDPYLQALFGDNARYILVIAEAI